MTNIQATLNQNLSFVLIFHFFFLHITETLVRSLVMLKRIRPGTIKLFDIVTFSSVQPLGHVGLFETP